MLSTVEVKILNCLRYRVLQGVTWLCSRDIKLSDFQTRQIAAYKNDNLANTILADIRWIQIQTLYYEFAVISQIHCPLLLCVKLASL